MMNPVECRIKALHRSLRPTIRKRLAEFRALWATADDRTLFRELAFCLFTPQASAERCWETVLRLERKGLLFRGTAEAVAPELTRIRFLHTKARRLVEARALFLGPRRRGIRRTLTGMTSEQGREWLVGHVKGIGMKEAGHFLRNIGFAFDLAILDRHVFRVLHEAGYLEEVPGSLTHRRYLELEKVMDRFADDLDIPLAELDLTLWAIGAGTVFK
jgi:N-glycosylase/DNA lyase